MRFHRLPVKDPRTVARDIPGICDLLFPQLLPSIVAHLNREASGIAGCSLVPLTWTNNTSMNSAMLFEIAYVRAEQIIMGKNENWENCFLVAQERQLKYFDAVLPNSLSEVDIEIARQTAENLVNSLNYLKNKLVAKDLKLSPVICGYQWISKGNGDFSLDRNLVEVKCTGRNFSSADFRQLLIYWLLSYSASLENKGEEWQKGILLNPRLNKYVEFEFGELVKMAGAGRTKIEILELFSSIIGSYKHSMSI